MGEFLLKESSVLLLFSFILIFSNVAFVMPILANNISRYRECNPLLYLVIEEADLQYVLYTGDAVGHAEVTQRVAHQHDVAVFLQLLEVVSVTESTVVLVVHVDEFTLKALQDTLHGWETEKEEEKTVAEPFSLSTRQLVKSTMVGSL